MSSQIYEPIRGLSSTKSRISVTQYNRMVDVCNSLQAATSGGSSVASDLVAGNFRVRVTRSTPRVDSFPWSKIPFGYAEIDATHVIIYAGAVIKRTYAPLPVAESTQTLLAGTTYIGISILRDMSDADIIVQADEPATDDSRVKFWFYRYELVSGVHVLAGINLGQLMNVDITAYGD